MLTGQFNAHKPESISHVPLQTIENQARPRQAVENELPDVLQQRIPIRSNTFGERVGAADRLETKYTFRSRIRTRDGEEI